MLPAFHAHVIQFQHLPDLQRLTTSEAWQKNVLRKRPAELPQVAQNLDLKILDGFAFNSKHQVDITLTLPFLGGQTIRNALHLNACTTSKPRMKKLARLKHPQALTANASLKQNLCRISACTLMQCQGTWCSLQCISKRFLACSNSSCISLRHSSTQLDMDAEEI